MTKVDFLKLADAGYIRTTRPPDKFAQSGHGRQMPQKFIQGERP